MTKNTAVSSPVSAAQDYHVASVANNSLGGYFFSSTLDSASQYSADELQDFFDDMSVRLQNNFGFSTTFEEVLAQAEITGKVRLSYWSGMYWLKDDQDNHYRLSIKAADATLTMYDGTQLSSSSFNDGVLHIENEQLAFELQFALPTDAAGDAATISDMLANSQPRCVGTVTMKTLVAMPKHAIRGKRGCFSDAGLDYTYDGDPASTWAGVYSMSYTDNADWQPLGDTTLSILVDVEGKPNAKWGELQAYNLLYRANCLMFDVTIAGVVTNVACSFRTNMGGKKWFLAGVNNPSGARPITGFYIGPIMRITMAREMDKMALQPKLFLKSGAAPSCKDGYQTFSLPWSDLTTASKYTAGTATFKGLSDGTYDFSDGVVINQMVYLPTGVEANTYNIVLNIEGAPTTATFIWSLVLVTKAEPAPNFDLVNCLEDLKKQKGLLRASPGETQHAGFWSMYLKVVTNQEIGTNKSKVLYIPAQVQIDSRENIIVNGADLPPCVRGKSYQHVISVTGGTRPLIWTLVSADSSDSDKNILISENGFKTGLAWSIDSNDNLVISGTPDQRLNQNTTSLAFRVSSSGVVMDPTLVTLDMMFTEPDVYGQEGMNWTTFMLAALAVSFGLVKWLRTKSWKKITKPDEGPEDTSAIALGEISKDVALIRSKAQLSDPKILTDTYKNAVKIELNSRKDTSSAYKRAIKQAKDILEREIPARKEKMNNDMKAKQDALNSSSDPKEITRLREEIMDLITQQNALDKAEQSTREFKSELETDKANGEEANKIAERVKF